MTAAKLRSQLAWMLLALGLSGCSRGPTPLQQGVAALDRKDYESAIAYFDRAIEADPANATAWAHRGQAYSVLGDPARAITNYDEALRRDPTNAAFYLSRAFAHRQLRNFALAVADCNSALQLAPDNSAAYVSRGIAYHESGEQAKAIADYNAAIQRGDTTASVYVSRGVAHHETGDYARALADFDEAIRKEPDNSAAYNNRAMTHRKKGDLPAAIADYEQAIKHDRESAYAYAGLAWIWATALDPAVRDGNKAVNYAQKACELTGWERPYCLNALAAAYAEAGQFDQAVRWQAKALGFAGFPPAEAGKAEVRLKMYRARQPFRE